jgi:hypothetical protein
MLTLLNELKTPKKTPETSYEWSVDHITKILKENVGINNVMSTRKDDMSIKRKKCESSSVDIRTS